MRQLEAALHALADRGEALQPEVLIARIETELGWTAVDAVAPSEETVMVTHEPIERETTTPPRTEKPTRRRIALVFGAAAIVLAAGVGVAWLAGVFGEEPELDAFGTLEIAIVHEMTNAFNRYDAAGYAAYWAEGASGREGIVVKSSEWDEFVADEATSGAHIELSDCVQDALRVTCVVTRTDDDFTAATGVEWAWEATYVFNDDGIIQSVDYENEVDGVRTFDEINAFVAAFGTWLETAHPDIYPTFYVPDYGTTTAAFWIAGVPELGPYIEEFVAQSDVYPLR